MDHDHRRTASRCSRCGATPRQLLQLATNPIKQPLALCEDCQGWRDEVGALEMEDDSYKEG